MTLRVVLFGARLGAPRSTTNTKEEAMPISDYAHHNEEAARVWWEEEGRHADEREPMDDDDRESYGAADAFAEELAEYEDEALLTLLADEEYHARWPKARPIIEDEVRDRGSVVLYAAKRRGLMQ